MHRPPVTELSARVGKFQEALKTREIAGALIVQNADFYYFTGMIWAGYLFIPAEGAPVLLNRHRSVVRMPMDWPVAPMGRFEELATLLADHGLAASGAIGLELDVIPALLWQRLQKALPGRELVDVGRLARQVRTVKSAWEIEVMRSYGKTDLELWAQVPRLIAESGTDLELAAAFESRARLLGEQSFIRMRSFNMEMSIACTTAGENGAALSSYDVPISGVGLSSYFPFGASGAPLQSGNPITIDYGSCYASYVLDHTRTFAVDFLPDLALRAFDTVLAIQQETVSLARPGVLCGELYDRARAIAEKAGLVECFMGAGGGVPFLGHGVGLEVDELPVLARGSREVLEEGMVIAMEPKFALKGIGAIGVENCYLIKKDGVEKLTVAPDELVVVKK